MSDLKYDVVFTGKFCDGFEAAAVKENFTRLFKLPKARIEHIFSTPRVVLKTGLERKTADKYKAVLAQAGAEVTIEAQQPEDTLPASVSEKAGADAAPAAPMAKNVGPLWGRKVESGAVATAPETGPGHGSQDGKYGSLERGIAGNYQFTIGDTLSEAWQKVSGNKGTILLAGLIYMAVFMALSLGTALISGLITAVAGETGSVVGTILGQVIQVVVTAPIIAGLFMLGVRMSVGAPAGAGSVLSYYDRILPLALTMILMYVMLALGFLLLVIPGIYLSIAYLLALPLVVDKGLSPWQALEASRKAITPRWFAVSGLLLLLCLLFMLGAIPLLIGLIWVTPLYLIAMGILYRNIFGVSSVAPGP